jgi:hypothetical protein
MGLVNQAIDKVSQAFNSLLKGSNSESNSAAPAAVQRQVPQGRGTYVTKEPDENGNTIYYAHVPWQVTLLDKHNHATLGPGIRVDEKLDPATGGIGYTATKNLTGHYWTDKTGSVPDNFKLPFNARNGEVTIPQHILVNRLEAKWDATVRLHDGDTVEVQAQQWAPFH